LEKKVSKNAEFHTDFKSVEKVLKIYQKKLLANVTVIYTFRQTCFAYNFFGAFLYNFFSGFEISMKLCVF